MDCHSYFGLGLAALSQRAELMSKRLNTIMVFSITTHCNVAAFGTVPPHCECIENNYIGATVLYRHLANVEVS